MSLPASEHARQAGAPDPVHTRMLEIELLQQSAARYRCRATVLDLRKRGFVPLAGELQGSGFIHQMHLDLEIDAGSRVVEQVDVRQPYVAFEESEDSGGECCRDPAPRLQALVGECLDPAFARTASRLFGGALGCSHLLTLAQTVGRSLPFAIEAEASRLASGGSARSAGERIFKRSLFIDGFVLGAATDRPIDSETGDGDSPDALRLAIQLHDLHTRARAELTEPLDRLLHQQEVRVGATIALQNFTLEALCAAERARSREDLERSESARWTERAAAVDPLVGRGIMPGLGSELFRRFEDEASDRMLLDALLHLAPGFIQCVAALTDSWVGRGGSPPAYATAGGGNDACYMWRREGAFAAARERFAAATVQTAEEPRQ